jgi:DNA-binding IclR family transcriptional regulator
MDVLIPQEALTRIQMEYVEMPGLKLTPKQIGRLCGLPQETCEGALALLLRTGFLRRSPDGAFLRPGVPRSENGAHPRAVIA